MQEGSERKEEVGKTLVIVSVLFTTVGQDPIISEMTDHLRGALCPSLTVVGL